MKTHKHKAVSSIDRCFSGPVSKRENPAAHGNICTIETCRCGAERRTNINGRHIERGSWTEMDDNIEANHAPFGFWPGSK